MGRRDRQHPADRLAPLVRPVIVDEHSHVLNRRRAPPRQNRRSLCAGSRWLTEVAGSPVQGPSTSWRHLSVRRRGCRCRPPPSSQVEQGMRRTANLSADELHRGPARGLLAFVLQQLHTARARTSEEIVWLVMASSNLAVAASSTNPRRVKPST